MVAGTISSNVMRNQKSIFRNLGDMEQGILLKIFMTLNVMDLVSSVSVVCTTWHSVCRDPILWGTLNLSVLFLKPFITPQEAHTLCDEELRRTATNL
jgi:hypothetical protein